MRTLVSGLCPQEAEAAHDWLVDGRQETVRALACGHPFAFTVRHKGAEVAWTARPVLFLELADRRATPLSWSLSTVAPLPIGGL
ncbi:hypothetical protein [Peterkaempfera bronchialis]|uniref:hypothetical protein n=1 Tax=Peterkaempfera bronchialis TaxID=2126346 RepID=UPI003C2C712A